MRRINADKFYKGLQGLMIVGTAIFGVFAVTSYFNRPSANPPSLYFVVKSAVQEKVGGIKIHRFVSPTELKVERVTENETNVFGWVILTNLSGQSSTQNFRCSIAGQGAPQVRFQSDFSVTNKTNTERKDSNQ